MSELLIAAALIASIIMSINKDAQILKLEKQLEECTKHTNP